MYIARCVAGARTVDYLGVKEHTTSAGDKDFFAGIRVLQHARGQPAYDVGSVAHPERSIGACAWQTLVDLQQNKQADVLQGCTV